MMGVHMRNVRLGVVAAAVAISVVAVTGMAPAAHAQSCDVLTCEEDCRAEQNACEMMRSTLKDWLKAFCKMDALDVRFDCVDAKTLADESCGDLCGDDFKACRSSNKLTYKLCLSNAKPGEAECKADMKAELAEAKAGCALDFDACRATCSGT